MVGTRERRVSRVDASVLVREAQVLPTISPGSVRLWGRAISCGIAAYVIFLVDIYLGWLTLFVVVPVSVYATRSVWLRFSGVGLAKFIHDRIIAPRNLPRGVMLGRRVVAELADGLSAGTWICRQGQYESWRKGRSEAATRAERFPLVRYRFVVATHPATNNQGVFAFSHGAVKKFSYASNVFVVGEPRTAPDPGLGEDPLRDSRIAAIASALEEAIRLLAKDDRAFSTSDIRIALGDVADEDEVSLALVAAARWNLIRAILPNPPAAGRHGHRDTQLFQITDTGRTWNLASPELLSQRTTQRRKMGTARRKNGPRVNNFFGNVGAIYQDSDISGTQTFNQAEVPEQEYIAGLLKLLAAPGVSWGEPYLAEARTVIEEAATQKSTRNPKLREAVSRVLVTCGDAALRALGDDTYHLLAHIRL